MKTKKIIISFVDETGKETKATLELGKNLSLPRTVKPKFYKIDRK